MIEAKVSILFGFLDSLDLDYICYCMCVQRLGEFDQTLVAI